MITVTCTKYGSKYSSDYVNCLYRMLRKNLAWKFQLVCFTDNPQGIHSEILIHPLIEPRFKGWWQKVAYFKKPFPISHANFTIALDLDMIILQDLNEIVQFAIDKPFVTLQDAYPQNGFNSSVMIFNAQDEQLTPIYEDLLNYPGAIYQENTGENSKNRPKNASNRFWGDQIWITEQLKKYQIPCETLPESWVRSYKLAYKKHQDCDTKIVLFHGEPKPHDLSLNDPLRKIWNA